MFLLKIGARYMILQKRGVKIMAFAAYAKLCMIKKWRAGCKDVQRTL